MGEVHRLVLKQNSFQILDAFSRLTRHVVAVGEIQNGRRGGALKTSLFQRLQRELEVESMNYDYFRTYLID